MSRPQRKYVIPSRDAVVTTGEMIVVLPEDDRAGNAMKPTPFVNAVWGRAVPPGSEPPPPADEADKPATS
jgi:hypothetical protein